jgi:hypothetical protein
VLLIRSGVRMARFVHYAARCEPAQSLLLVGPASDLRSPCSL